MTPLPQTGAISDHPLRAMLVAELHARPSPVIKVPAEAHFIALRPERRSQRDHHAERIHLSELLAHHGVPGPPDGATHWAGQIGSWFCKWESHTEIATYLFWHEADDVSQFGQAVQTPEGWLGRSPGLRIASANLRIERIADDDAVLRRVADWFDGDSLAISRVLDDQLVIAGDFLPDAAGSMRFAAFAREGTGARPIGQVVQRLCEIETYRALAMLGFARARELSPELGRLEGDLATIAHAMTDAAEPPAQTLNALLDVGGKTEQLVTRSSFRFSATAAYKHLVEQRIDSLRETRFKGRQTFHEFMTRRHDPAMRTVASTERRLQALSDRVLRAGELLRTRVDVEHSEQNRELLRSMDRRSDMALKLQHTVEGLSVVAISYYAASLALYVFSPFLESVGFGKSWATAVMVPVVIAFVWLGLWRIRRGLRGPVP